MAICKFICILYFFNDEYMNLQKAMVVFFLALLLFSCGKADNKNGEVSPTLPSSGLSTTSGSITLDTYGIQKDTFDALKNKTSLEDLNLVFLQKNLATTPVVRMGSDFFAKLQAVTPNNIQSQKDGGIQKTDLDVVLKNYDQSLVRELTLKLNIHDYKTKQPIAKGKIFVNGVNIGSFSDGKFEWSFHWLEWVELFHILVRSEEYWDAVLVLNSLNSRGELLMGDVLMKKAFIKELTLKDAQNISAGRVKISLKACTLVSSDGQCYEWKATLKVNFIEWNEANGSLLSMNMDAITQDNKMVYLNSGWMAFIEFITPSGEILRLKSWETIWFEYQVSLQDIQGMQNTKNGNGKKNGYWYYNKLAGVWQESQAHTKLDTQKRILYIDADVLY